MGEDLLIKNAKSGDKAAAETLIEKYAPMVFNLSFKLMGNYNDASDASQEALIKIYSSIKGFKGKSAFSTWVYRITYNSCMDLQRKRKNNIEYEINSAIKDHAPSPHSHAEGKEIKEVIQGAIYKLQPNYRAAVVLRDVMGVSYSEIAEILGCSAGTVKSRISRGRERLRELLRPYMEQSNGEYRQTYERR